ncbi:MAG: DUF1275 domain-containing protein [Ruminococcus sp.]|nr:DUF1275 domain-containing protein [Ruminococcus sp.]
MRIKINNFTHYNMAVAGGVFGGFAVCNLGEIFGNAQTLNLIGIVYNLVYCNFETLLLRIIAALLYFLGFAAAVVIPKKLRLHSDVISIVVDILAFITLMFLPKNADFLISLYPIFFATAFQWTAFEYIEGYSCSTIFSSNNYRQFTTSLVEYAIDKDKSRLTKTRVFGLTLLYFHIGVALACISAIHFGRLSAFIGILVLLPTIYLLIKKRIIRLKNIKTQTNDAKRDT